MTASEKKLVALLSSSTIALLAACAFLGHRLSTRSAWINPAAALADPALRAEVVSRLAEDSKGAWDSHNDPEVGRVLQPNLWRRMANGALTDTNSMGLRERQFEMPKPEGTLRVALLGDSFVQGFGVDAQDRMGVFLERFLTEHATGWQGALECLHIGIGGWDATAESAYLRRMLTQLAPDLVIQILITNDLDDNSGVRGFGGLSAFSPLRTERTDARVTATYSAPYASPTNQNYLHYAADHESRKRYERLAGAVGRLAHEVRRSGGRYLAVSYWGWGSGKLWSFLEPVLELDEFLIFPGRLIEDLQMQISPTDRHWSRAGHELVAELLFVAIRRRGLLPELALTPWPELEERLLPELGEARVMAFQDPETWQPPADGLASLEPARFTDLEWRHVYTGLDEKGQVSPFASFYLARGGHEVLRLRGRGLDRAELEGARVRVSVEGQLVGEHEVAPTGAFDLRFPLPEGIRRHGGITVHLETSDYGYDGPNLQHCVSFVLEQLALEDAPVRSASAGSANPF